MQGDDSGWAERNGRGLRAAEAWRWPACRGHTQHLQQVSSETTTSYVLQEAGLPVELLGQQKPGCTTKMGRRRPKRREGSAQSSVNPASSNPVFVVVVVFRIFITFTYRKLNKAHSSQIGGQFFSLACSSLAMSPILGPGCCLPSDGGSHCICHCEWSGELPPA